MNLNQNLVELDTSYLIKNNGANLSVGQRKKLLILKFLSLYNQSEIIILDEIFAGLDIDTKKNFVSFLNHKIQEQEKIFIIISHEDCNLMYNKKLSL